MYGKITYSENKPDRTKQTSENSNTKQTRTRFQARGKVRLAPRGRESAHEPGPDWFGFNFLNTYKFFLLFTLSSVDQQNNIQRRTAQMKN